MVSSRSCSSSKRRTAGLVFGALAGYITSLLIAPINNDRIVETTLTAALALSSFIIAEHYLHLSGVIATVIAGC